MKALKSRIVLVCLSFISGIILSICLNIFLNTVIPTDIAQNPIYGILKSALISFVKNLLTLLILLILWDSGEALHSIHDSAKQKNANTVSIILYSCLSLVLCVLFNVLLNVLGLNVKAAVSYTAVDFVSLALIPAIVEETAYRYIILGCFAEYGTSRAIFISAVFFALSHTSPEAAAYAFLCGLVLGYLYERTCSLYACIAVHFLNNALTILINIMT